MQAIPIDADGRFAGYASVFGKLDEGGDIVMPGAFRKSLGLRGRHRIKMLFQHDPKEPVGTWDAIREDGFGLWVEGRLVGEAARHAALRARPLAQLRRRVDTVCGLTMAEPYKFDTRSDATRALQRALATRGFYRDAVDGIFGRKTQAAVEAARAAFGLPAGGVDAALLQRLGLNPPTTTISDFLAKLLLDRAAAIFISQLKGRLPMNFLAGYRTYIIAAAMLLTGLAGLVGVDIPSFTGQAPGNLVMEALAFFFLRQGLKTGGGRP